MLRSRPHIVNTEIEDIYGPIGKSIKMRLLKIKRKEEMKNDF